MSVWCQSKVFLGYNEGGKCLNLRVRLRHVQFECAWYLKAGIQLLGCRRNKTVDFRYTQHSVMLPAFEDNRGVNQFSLK